MPLWQKWLFVLRIIFGCYLLFNAFIGPWFFTFTLSADGLSHNFTNIDIVWKVLGAAIFIFGIAGGIGFVTRQPRLEVGRYIFLFGLSLWPLMIGLTVKPGFYWEMLGYVALMSFCGPVVFILSPLYALLS